MNQYFRAHEEKNESSKEVIEELIQESIDTKDETFIHTNNEVLEEKIVQLTN